jgi:lysophospholipase L1-like esterase
MWFRFLLILLTLCAWGSLTWLASHRSSAPEIFSRYSVGYAILLASWFLATVALTLANRSKPFDRIYRHRSEIVLSLIALLVGAALAEVAVRVLDPLGISYYEESKRYQFAKLPDPELVYRHPANWRTHLQGVEVETNELGLRDRTIHPKPRDELRVLILGDSVAFGWGVSEGDTFTRRLEQVLTERVPRPIRTINSGVGSYNTEQELAFVRKNFELVTPDVILLIVVENDDDTHVLPFSPSTPFELSGKSPPEAIKIALGHSWIYRLAVHLHRYRTPSQSSPSLNTEGWRRMLVAFGGFGAFCSKRKIICIPVLYRLLPTDKTNAMLSALTEISAEHGLKAVDTLPWFSGLDVTAITNSSVDSHPNADGHGILAANLSHIVAAAVSGDGGR